LRPSDFAMAAGSSWSFIPQTPTRSDTQSVLHATGCLCIH
jgi:hypothetical protein